MTYRLKKTFDDISKLSFEDQNQLLDLINPMIDIKLKSEKKKTNVNERFRNLTHLSIFTRKILGMHVKSILVNSENGLFAVDPEDCVVGYELRKKGRYGQREIAIIKNFINSRSKILIVGAHIGTLAIPISKLSLKTYAIEANPSTYELLSINVSLNGLTNCFPINIAAGDKSEYIRFLQNTVNSGGSKRKPKIENLMYTYDEPEEITVKSEPLDDFLTEKEFDVIIMDLEGSEYFALKGMQKLLYHTKVLIMEFIPHHLKNISSVSVDDLLELLNMFDYMTIPSKEIKVAKENFSKVLNWMFENEEIDDGIIFEKK